MLLKIVNLTVSTRTALLNVVVRLAGLKLVTMDVVSKTALFGSNRMANGTVNTARMMVLALIWTNSALKTFSRVCKRPLKLMPTLSMMSLKLSAPLMTQNALTVAKRSKPLLMAATLTPKKCVKRMPLIPLLSLKWLTTKWLESLAWLKTQLLWFFKTTLTCSSPQSSRASLIHSRTKLKLLTPQWILLA